MQDVVAHVIDLEQLFGGEPRGQSGRMAHEEIVFERKEKLRSAGLALAVTASFFVLEAGAHHLLSDTVPESVGRDPFQLTLIVAVLVAFGVLVAGDPATRAERLRRLSVLQHQFDALPVDDAVVVGVGVDGVGVAVDGRLRPRWFAV